IGAEVDRELVEAVAAEIVLAIGDGRLAHDRLVDAVTRTAGMASWTATPRSMPAPDAGLGVAAARRAVRIEGSLVDLGSPLVVQLVSGYSIAEGRVPWGLAPHLDGAEQVEVVAAEASPEALTDRAGTRPIVVVGRHTHRLPASRALIERLAASHAVGVVEMGWPSDWRPAHAKAFVTTHGASLANGRAAAEALGIAG
ncbi:MAG: glycoside hydrolase family 3 protein, partial [Actinoplanes sp.]